MEDHSHFLKTVPLRQRGDCPVPINWEFKTAPRWKRRMMIERAFALDDARRRTSQEEIRTRSLPAEGPLLVADLDQQEMDKLVRLQAARQLARGPFRGAETWNLPRVGAKKWTFSVDAPTRVMAQRGDELFSLSLWPRDCLAELLRLLRDLVPRQCRLSGFPGARAQDLVLQLEKRSAPAAGPSRGLVEVK